MCQLLGMNANTPTDVMFSFTGLATRADEHEDGFGIAFFEGKGVRLFVDPESAVASPVAELVRRYPIKSGNVIAHIRKATRGQVALQNTHPFGAARLADEDLSVDFCALTTPGDRVALVATQALTAGEDWVAFGKGELRLFVDGRSSRGQVCWAVPTPLPATAACRSYLMPTDPGLAHPR
jgi:predicted glutamine amidotransferase